MKSLNILFGFNSPDFVNGVVQDLFTQGYSVNYATRTTKATIRDFVMATPNVDTMVLLESFPNASGEVERFTAEELAQLTDERDINIIIVLNANLVGSDYMRILYYAGITSAIYQEGRHGGATISSVVELAKNKRSRKATREYYQIDMKPAEFSSLENDDFVEKLEQLTRTSEESLVSKFVEISRSMSQKQLAAFISGLPADIFNELALYEEFHIVVAFLKKCGLDLKIRRPKIMRIGLVKPAELKPFMNSGVDISQNLIAYYEEEEVLEDESFIDDERVILEDVELLKQTRGPVDLMHFLDDEEDDETKIAIFEDAVPEKVAPLAESTSEYENKNFSYEELAEFYETAKETERLSNEIKPDASKIYREEQIGRKTECKSWNINPMMLFCGVLCAICTILILSFV